MPNDKLLANSKIDTFMAFSKSFKGGVNVAAGRNLAAAGGDFLVLAPAHGKASCEIAKDANSNFLLSDDLATAEKLDPFGKHWAGGITVAVGDVGSPSTNPELIFGMGPGGPPRVTIFSDKNLNGTYGDDGGPVSSFLAYNSHYRGGVRVAYSRLSPANVGQSGEVVVAPGGGNLPVEVFKSLTNTGEIMDGDATLATIFPFGFTMRRRCPWPAAATGLSAAVVLWPRCFAMWRFLKRKHFHILAVATIACGRIWAQDGTCPDVSGSVSSEPPTQPFPLPPHPQDHEQSIIR